MFICAEGENFSFAKSIGVGLVDSAMFLTSLILKEAPKELIFIGSAGSYDNKLNVFDVFCSTIATQIETSFITHDSYTPILNKIENNFYDVSCETSIIVNSSNYITTDTNVSSCMLNAGILLENMEFFSILRVAQYFGIPVLGIFCITNYCNREAHNSFIENHIKSMQILESYVRENYAKYI